MEDRVKVGIPMFNSRVSPRFEFAPKVLVATVDDGRVVDRGEYSLNNFTPMRRNALLKEQGVDVLICGGISEFFVRLLMSNGIEVIPMVSGEAEEVLHLFINGNLDAATTPIPSARRFGRHRGRRRKSKGRSRDFTLK